MNLRNKITIAISSDFLSAFSEIPKKEQKKVREFVEAFKKNPQAPRFNYEKINAASDKNIRSVRINHVYRGIILKPEVGNVYMLLWVDSHDEAYAWAMNKSFDINPQTGGIQIVDTSVKNIDKSEEIKDVALFSSFSNKDLINIGVPEVLLPLVRSVIDEKGLDNIEKHLPGEVYEALFLLAAGDSIKEIKASLNNHKSDISTNDFAKALDNPDSKRRFHVVENEIELAEILNWPLEKWRVFLHPSQQKIVQRNYNGPARVLGGAGTGKTVVAIHRAKFLLENIWTESNERILFTTFTKNLANDIRENLKKICSDDILKRIDVINLDAWVVNFLNKNNYKYRVAIEKDLKPIWDDVLNEIPEDLNLTASFYKNEWKRVIQANGVTNLREYYRVARIGMRKRLNRTTRKRIWPIFEEYRAQLQYHGYKELTDAIRDARIILENSGDILPYRSILVDESQDFSKEAFKLIRQMIPISRENKTNDIFLVGDSHQRIYNHKVVLSHCGINIMGRGNKLKINYRTTEETRKWSINLLKGLSFDDLDGGEDNLKGYKSLLHGAAPLIKHFTGFGDDARYLVEYIKNLIATGEEVNSICLVARTNEMLRQYEGALKFENIPTFTIRHQYSESKSQRGIRLATMHRVKGLEFNHVIIVAVNKNIVPPVFLIKDADSDQDLAELEKRERCLLYVAATRAKKSLLITSFGKSSKFLDRAQFE